MSTNTNEPETIEPEIDFVCDRCEDTFTEDQCEPCTTVREHRYVRNTTNPARTSLLDNDLCYCEHCADNHTFTCDACADTYTQDSMQYEAINRTHISIIVCHSCYADSYFTCESCDTIMHNDHYEQDGYCQSCHEADNEDNEEKGIIKPYHSGQYHVKFVGKDRKLMPYMGFELEIESTSLTAGDLSLEVKSHLTGFRVEEDGSLDDGFEIISNAMTYKEHKRDSGHYRKLLTALIENDARSHDTKTCGLHVHCSRKYLNSIKIDLMIQFFYENQSKIEKFSRRKSNQYAEFKENLSETTCKYSAINIKPCNTIEFRCFKGTLNIDTLISTLQFVHLFHNYTIECSKNADTYLQWSSFIDYVLKRQCQYKQLVAYLKLRKLL